MGRKLHFKLGSFYRVDDVTGFPQRAERTEKQWNNLIVDRARWEARQPQDFVRGVKDIQAVPEPRPLGANTFVGPIYTQLADNAVIGQTVIDLTYTRGFFAGAEVGIMLDNGQMFITSQVGAPGAGTITLAQGLTYAAASNNVVVNYSAPPPTV